MSSSPSFERFDYLLRTNKQIERRLVFEALHSAAQRVGFQNHWYLGFGSMWFGDFKMAHRLLSIDQMVSIELKDHAPRAKFNSPYGGVRVEAGVSSEVLERLAEDTWNKPVIAWLDYDGRLDQDVVADVEYILNRGMPNSVIIVTVNGARGTYRGKEPKAREQTALGMVESVLGTASISPTYSSMGSDVLASDFPQFLAESMLTFMQHRVVESARQHRDQRLQFVPLYCLHHKDGADMVTVGGALVEEQSAQLWMRCLQQHRLICDETGAPRYCRLDLVPVTIKEKIVLDSCLPFPHDDAEYIRVARAAGLELKDEDMQKYRRFYRQFPVFVETPV